MLVSNSVTDKSFCCKLQSPLGCIDSNMMWTHCFLHNRLSTFICFFSRFVHHSRDGAEVNQMNQCLKSSAVQLHFRRKLKHWAEYAEHDTTAPGPKELYCTTWHVKINTIKTQLNSYQNVCLCILHTLQIAVVNCKKEFFAGIILERPRLDCSWKLKRTWLTSSQKKKNCLWQQTLISLALGLQY